MFFHVFDVVEFLICGVVLLTCDFKGPSAWKTDCYVVPVDFVAFLSAMAADRPALDLSVAGVKPDSVALISTCPAVSFPEIDAIGPESMLARHNKGYRMRPFLQTVYVRHFDGSGHSLGSHGAAMTGRSAPQCRQLVH